MLVALYYAMVEYVVPEFISLFAALTGPVMVIVIILAGMVMLFGAAGMRISSGLGSTVVGGIFSAIGYLVQALFNALGWLIRWMSRTTPRVFRGSQQTFSQLGLNSVLANVLAAVVTVLFIIVII